VNRLKKYKKQASKFLKFTGPNKAQFKFNSKWLGKMKFEDVLNLASHMTVDQMLKRDMFKTRMEEQSPIYIHEFLYPLMQGYDSVAMKVDVEIGGNDQTFNMLAGRHLSSQLINKDKTVVATKLLVDNTGKKMREVFSSVNFFLRFLKNNPKKRIKDNPQIRYSDTRAVKIIPP
jgi:tyrosyl-tRNA synthetase